MNTTTILLIIVVAVLILPALRGYFRGFLAMVFSVASIVLSIALVTPLQPIVRGILKDQTPLERTIETAVEEAFTEQANKALRNAGISSGSSLSGVTLTPELEGILKEAFNLPDSWREDLTSGARTNVAAFIRNISESAASIALDAVSYVLTFILIFIVIKVLFFFLGWIGKLPVLSGINRFLGAVLGVGEGLLILWILCRVATAFLPSEIGPQVMEAINGNEILSFLYNTLYSIGGSTLSTFLQTEKR